VSNPAEPVEVGCTSAVPWPGAESAFAGRYFISNSTRGGIIIEERPTGSLAGSVEVASYAVWTARRLEWRQPADRWIPLPALTEPEPMYVRNYTFDERYLYLANVLRVPGDYCCGRLTILDLENPAQPRHISTTPLPAEYAPLHLKVTENFLFISFYEARGYNPYMAMYDIRDKGKPVEVVSVPGLELPQVHNGYAYLPGRSGMDLWDLEEEDKPELVSVIDFPGISEATAFLGLNNSFVFVGDTIYLADRGTLAVLDNHDPTNPFLVSQMQFGHLPKVERLPVSGGRMGAITTVMLNGELRFLEGEAAQQMGEWKPLPEPGERRWYEDIAIAGDYLYSLDVHGASGIRGSNVYIFDMSDPAEPAQAGHLFLENFRSQKMAAAFPYLYLLKSEQSPALGIIDISDPANPFLTAELALEASYYQDLVVWEENLYIASTVGNGGPWRSSAADHDN
jgi:hypothetical protein